MLHKSSPAGQAEEKFVWQLEDVSILAVLHSQGHRAYSNELVPDTPAAAALANQNLSKINLNLCYV